MRSPSLPLGILTSCLALGLTLAGCDKGSEEISKDEASEKKPDSDKADAPKGDGANEAPKGEEPAAAPAEDAPVIDEDIVKDIASIVANCEVNVDGCTVNDCKGEETKKLEDRFKKDGDKADKIAALDTWAQALGSDDAETQTVAANVLGKVFRYLDADSKVSPAVAKRVVEAAAKLPNYQAAQSIQGITHVAVLGGEIEGLKKMAAAHEYAKVLVPMVHENVMTHGRLDAFATVEAGAAGDDVKIRVASLTAPRRMQEPTEAEKAKVCPWAKGYLQDAEESAFVQAGHTMTWCGGEYIDALLDEGEARLAKHEFSREMSFVFRDICFTPMGNKVAGSDEQCERNYKYLEDVTNDKEIDSQSRSLALFGIYYQRRDEETLKLAKKYTKSKDEEIKKRADEIVETLKERLKK